MLAIDINNKGELRHRHHVERIEYDAVRLYEACYLILLKPFCNCHYFVRWNADIYSKARLQAFYS